MKALKQKIMRRVYYIFALRLILHPIFFHALLLGLSIFALSRVVSIPNVLVNLMDIKVGGGGRILYWCVLIYRSYYYRLADNHHPHISLTFVAIDSRPELLFQQKDRVGINEY